MLFRFVTTTLAAFLPTLLLLLLFSDPLLAKDTGVEPLAEGKYSYLKPTDNDTILATQWAKFAEALPNFKEKAKKAHYRFKEGVVGRKCDTKDCHPGFKDGYVERLLALPEGSKRMEAREDRTGLSRCDDCHSYDTIKAKTIACRLHYQLKERVQCNSCHTEGKKAFVAVGEKKRVTLQEDHDQRLDWPAHQLTKDEKKIACDQNCHIENNSFAITSDCASCHGKGKLELSSYISTNLLVHSTAKDSIIPSVVRNFYKIAISYFALFCAIFILLDIIRTRKEGKK
jgi:hypothetical protein